MLAEIQLNAEVWRMARLAIALFQPLLVLLLLIGLVLAIGHLLTMIGTRWGDHRASSKAMFFSVAMHLLLVGGLIALIPEYRAIEFLTLSTPELEPIQINVPQGNTRNPVDETDEDPGFDLSATTYSQVPLAVPGDRSMIGATETATPELPEPLPKPMEATPEMPERSRDLAADLNVPQPSPEQARPAQMEPQREEIPTGAEPQLQSLPQQSRPGEGMLAKTERSALPAAPTESPQTPFRPDVGTSDRPAERLAPDRQSSEAMTVPSEQATLRTPDPLPTTRDDIPAPAGLTPRMLGQSTPVAVPTTPTPERSRLEMRTPPAELSGAGIGRLRPGGMELSTITEAPLRPTAVPDRRLPAEMPVETPQLTRVENPFQPQVGMNRVPSVYRLRSDDERGKAVLKFGGSQETEDAVDRSLAWMASVQDPAGYWHAGDYDDSVAPNPESTGIDNRPDVGITSLAVLSFLGKQNTVEQGIYSPVVNRALRWIISQQTSRHWGEGWGSTDGYLGGSASEYEAMYCHAMATFALAEAYAMSRNSPDAQWLRVPLEKAVSFILDTQNVDGGWRYVKGQREGDMSIFGWQLMALKSAQAAGIPIEERRLAMMRRFLNERRIGSSGGLAGFRPRDAASASAAAETLYCRQMLGMTEDPQATQEAVKVIVSNLPRRNTLNYYYWYYGTLALYQHGGPEWEQWNTAVRNMLVAEQRRVGTMAGSWDPLDVWGSYGGRMYSTAIATLSLEVYYRYLPLYRMNEPANLQ